MKRIAYILLGCLLSLPISAVVAQTIVDRHLGRVFIAAGVDTDAPTIADAAQEGSGPTGISMDSDVIYLTINGDGAGGATALMGMFGGSLRSSEALFLTPDGTLTATDAVTFSRADTNVVKVGGNTAAEMGQILAGRVVTADTDGGTIGAAADAGRCWSNEGASGSQTFTLPNDPPAGATACFGVVAAFEMSVVPNTGESLYFEGDQCDVDLASSTVGDILTVTAFTGGSGGIWIGTGSFACNDV